MKEHGKTIIDMLRIELSEEEQKKLFIEDGFEQGLQQGREETLTRLSMLGKLLEEAGRTSDAILVMTDPAYRQQLFEEFGL